MDENKLKILLGCRIKQLRELRNLTQEQFCAKINLEQPNLSNLENGKNFPAFATFLSILEVLEVNPNELLDFLGGYPDLNLSDELDKEIFKYVNSLSRETKQVILGIIKNKVYD